MNSSKNLNSTYYGALFSTEGKFNEVQGSIPKKFKEIVKDIYKNYIYTLTTVKSQYS